MSSHANRSGGAMAGVAVRTIITRTGAAAAAIVATLAMLLCTLAVGAVQAHAADAPDANLGVDLGSGATGYTVENLHQNGAKDESLKAVIKWRQDALNDTSVKWDGKTMKQYLADNNISESEYLSPKWSNALERIAIQRAVEANSFSDGHIRLNGELTWTAKYNGYGASSEILAWGKGSFAASMDQWASEKDAYVNKTGGETGHYLTLIDPGYKAYGFGAASSQEYGSVYAGEATKWTGWDETPTNLQGDYTVEANLSAAKLSQGVSANVPFPLTIGKSFIPVAKANVYNKRFTMRGTWESSNDSVAAIQPDGSVLGKMSGNATLTLTLTDGTTETFPVEVSSKSIKSITPPHVTVDSSTTKPTDQLPKTVEVTYDDGTPGTAAVTWDEIPGDWNMWGMRDAQHDVTVHGTVEGFADGVDLTLTVRQATVVDAWVSDGGVDPDVKTEVGVVPNLVFLSIQAEWSNGLYRMDSRYGLKWDQSDLVASRFANVGDKVTIHGTATIPQPDDSTKFWTFPVSLDVTVVAAEVKSVEPTQDTITTESGTAPDLSRVKAKVTYANGDTATTDVKWDAPAKADYSKREGGTFTVNGIANVGGTSHDLTVTVKVNPATITSATTDPASLSTPAGIDPTSRLPKTAKVTWSNGDSEDLDVRWYQFPEDDYLKEGNKFDITGYVEWNGVSHTVTLPVTVTAPKVKDAAADPAGVNTTVGVAPDLSQVKAKVTYTNGTTSTEDVSWDAVSADQYASHGMFTVDGTFTVNGETQTVRVLVTVNDATPTKAEVSSGVVVTVDSGTRPDLSNVLATVTWSNGTTTKEKVAWDEPMWADYGSRAGGDFTVNGTVSVDGQSFKVTATYRVNPATVKSVLEEPINVEPTTVGVQPVLPKTTKVTWSNGDVTDVPIEWQPVDVSKAGLTNAYGSVSVDGAVYRVSVQITINDNQCTTSFSDVTAATPHSKDITWLACKKISAGYANGDGTYSFGGMRLVVRQDMAAFLYRLAGSPAFDADAALRRNPFTDVNAATPHYREILWLYEVGIAKGYADGTFGGDRLVVRQDMAAFLHRFADQQGANPTLKDGVTFTDLAGAGHAEDIQWLARTGVTTGWKMDDGSYEFRGMNAVVRQDMAAFLHRMDMYVLK